MVSYEDLTARVVRGNLVTNSIIHHVAEEVVMVSYEDLTARVVRGNLVTNSIIHHVAEEVVMVSYEDLTARVVRGNLECTNGYIHILDNVIMKVSLRCFELVNLIELSFIGAASYTNYSVKRQSFMEKALPKNS